MRVAYVLGRGPQPRSSFTNDEIGAVTEHVALVCAALVRESDDPEWITAPPMASIAAWRSVAAWLIRRPLALVSAVASMVAPSLRSPRDAVVAIRSAVAACHLARTVDADLVHAQFAGPAAAGAYVWHRLTGRPYTVRAHAYDIYRPYRWAGTVLRSSAAVIAISDHGAQHILQRWGVEAAVIRVGINATAVAARDDRPAAVPMRWLSVGALEPKKGHDLLIAAVASVNHVAQRVTLDVYGDGSERVRLEAAANAAFVALHRPVDPFTMRGLYRSFDAFALASRIAPDGDIDGIPVVLMEAALAGLPIVTTTVAGIPELIEDGISGMTCDPDATGLARAIDKFASDYPAARRRADRARERVVSAHDLGEQARRLARLWSTLV